MYLDLLRDNIRETYTLGPDRVFESVKAWLRSRGFKEDDFSDPVFVDRQELSILKQSGTQYGPGDKVTILSEEYKELLEESNFLHHLVMSGLDNWEGYSDALQEYNRSILMEED